MSWRKLDDSTRGAAVAFCVTLAVVVVAYYPWVLRPVVVVVAFLALLATVVGLALLFLYWVNARSRRRRARGDGRIVGPEGRAHLGIQPPRSRVPSAAREPFGPAFHLSRSRPRRRRA